MTTPLLTKTALEQLSKIQVKVLPIKPVTGSSWNVGELALVYIEVANTTGAPLRDIVAETAIWGTAAKYYDGFSTWDGNGGYLGDLEPGETWKNYIALLTGVAAGSFTLIVKIGAEVVPFTSFWPAYAKYTVQPPT